MFKQYFGAGLPIASRGSVQRLRAEAHWALDIWGAPAGDIKNPCLRVGAPVALGLVCTQAVQGNHPENCRPEAWLAKAGNSQHLTTTVTNVLQQVAVLQIAILQIL